MDWPRTFIAGAKAAAFGALIGTSIPSLITLVLGVALLSDEGGSSLVIIFLPFAIGFAGAMLGLIAVALPMTLWLKRRGAESHRAYVTAGALAGGLAIGLIMLWLADGEPFSTGFFGVFGALTGGATGHFWWRFARKPEVEDGSERIAEVFG